VLIASNKGQVALFVVYGITRDGSWLSVNILGQIRLHKEAVVSLVFFEFLRVQKFFPVERLATIKNISVLAIGHSIRCSMAKASTASPPILCIRH
jgi:hypothetical protein